MIGKPYVLKSNYVKKLYNKNRVKIPFTHLYYYNWFGMKEETEKRLYFDFLVQMEKEQQFDSNRKRAT